MRIMGFDLRSTLPEEEWYIQKIATEPSSYFSSIWELEIDRVEERQSFLRTSLASLLRMPEWELSVTLSRGDFGRA